MKNHKLMFHLGMFLTVICIFGYYMAKSQEIKGMDIYFIIFGLVNILSAVTQYFLWIKNENKDDK